MAMEVSAKALLIIKGTPSRTTMPRAKNIQAMQRVLSGLPVAVDCAQNEIIRIQYNPSSLSIRTHAQGVKVNSVQKPGGTAGVRREEEPPSIELSVKLVLTAANSKDVFVADKFRLLAGDAVLDGVAITKTVSSGYAVHLQIDGLMRVIMDMDTGGVAFIRQNMVSEGQVNSLRSSYNMFNMSGNPVSGSIDMSTTQNINEASVITWGEAPDKCLTSGMVGKNLLEKAGNLINLNLWRRKEWAA